MIEKDIIQKNLKHFRIKDYIRSTLKDVGISEINIQRTPLGEKIIIKSSRPGLVIGGSGSNIKKLTKNLKSIFKLENPQIEIGDVPNINLVSSIVAERIASALERFGTMRFKGIGHKAMSDVIGAGGLGIEILISGKIPSARARVWRFYQGYLKKCGQIAIDNVDVAYKIANLKTGIVGIKVSIMPPGTKLPDDITVYKKEVEKVVEEELKSEPKDLKEEIKKEKANKKTIRPEEK